MNEKERAAMEQALEALEYENSWHESFKVRPYASTIDAVAALAQEPVASASPEELGYVPLSDDGRSVFIDGIGEVLLKLEPVQEPVGQILPDWSTEKECIDGTCVYLNDLGKNLPVGTKLYTAPPQREPVLLTDEEIDALPWNGSPRQFARAVEKAFLEKNK